MGTTSATSSSVSRPRFSLGWYRFIPFIAYHHVLMMLITAAIVLQSVLVAGCTSENLRSIYLFSLSYTDRTSPYEPHPAEVNADASQVLSSLSGNGTLALQVRAGYLGLCMTSGTGWICSTSATQLASIVGESDSDGLADPLNLIYAAEKFRSSVVFVGLIFISIPFSVIAFLLIRTFPNWHEYPQSEGSEREVKPFPSRPVSKAAAACLGVSTVMALLAGFWQHIGGAAAATMAEALTYGVASGGVGAGALVLGWLSFFLLMVAVLGLVVMILSIRVLASLGD